LEFQHAKVNPMNASEVLSTYINEYLPEFLGINLIHVNQVGHFGNSPLHVAAVRGNVDEVSALLAGGAEVNAKGEQGNTPLHEATFQGHLSVVELLILSGADPTVLNIDSRSPLEIAYSLERQAIAHLLQDIRVKGNSSRETLN
jgi:uncharacterized protein